MNFAEHTFHNSYLLQEIFSHARNQWCYHNLRDGDKVARKGLLKLLQLKAGFENNLQFTTNAIDYAAWKGYLDVIKWLRANRSELRSRQRSWQGCTTFAINYAASNGHLHVVKWFLENIPEYGDMNLLRRCVTKCGYRINIELVPITQN